ncbi:MAG: sensor histidine kinase [Vulcanococcus sp.]
MAIASTPATLTGPLRLRRRLGVQGAAFGLLLLGVFSAAVTLRLEAGAAVELPVRGQPEQLARLFTNLLANAIRFSPPGAEVLLQPRRLAARLQVAVIDQGPGIPPAHRQAVFERFWRLDRSGEASHSGLGLPIARAIARCHGGEVTLAAAEPGHCVLLVDLPAA